MFNLTTNQKSARQLLVMGFAAATAALALSACGGAERPSLVLEPDTTRTETQQRTPIDPSESDSDPSETTQTSETATSPALSSYRAISLVETLSVFDQPGNEGAIGYLDAKTEFGSARVLMVEQIAGDWVEVRLAQRPNESTGWVAASDVELEELPTVVSIDLEARSLVVTENGVVTSTQAVAVGTDENPTPTGTFFVTDKLDTSNDNGAYGPYALGLSGYSETLTEFAGGQGQIGIHGTNDPDSIGRAASHGCIRVPNEFITLLANDLPLGTMVVIS